MKTSDFLPKIKYDIYPLKKPKINNQTVEL